MNRLMLRGLATLVATAVVAQANAAMNEPVRTEAGLVAGIPARDASITVFKGLPYAAPPLGDLRWRAPQAPLAWQGVRKAGQFGSPCLQRQRNGWVGSEDCLFLNVWTGAASGSERRPVLVWSYGAGFTGNSGAHPLFDGEGLARKGLVVVTMNYRAGVMGFLATPELSRESGHDASGNYGMLDQIAVLQWVKKNIAAFGGDPDRVTIAGQSAGGQSTLVLMSSPLTQGLYHRAIMESRARAMNPSLKDAENTGTQYAESHGAHSLKELRAMPWQQLMEGDVFNRPVVDNYVVPADFFLVFANGLQHNVPIIAGNNLDENGAQPQAAVKLDGFREQVRQKFEAMADDALKLYPAASDQEAALAKNAIGRDDARATTFLMATQGRNSARNRSFTYFWTHAPPGPDRDRRGAYHESEINYVFDNLYATDRPWTVEDRRIADIMSSYWANFAASGDPNGKGLPQWPAVSAGSPEVMEVGDRFGPMPVAETPRLDFLRRFYLAHATSGGWR